MNLNNFSTCCKWWVLDVVSRILNNLLIVLRPCLDLDLDKMVDRIEILGNVLIHFYCS